MNPFYLQIEMDETGETNYQLMGISQLLAVPYAIEAGHARSLTLTDPDGREYEVTIDENGSMVISTEWLCGDTLVDLRDNQKYTTVQIGEQCWMKENLNIGTRIDGINNQTNNGIIEKYCYDNLESNCDTYGGLYQWNEMMQYVMSDTSHGICPIGWHIPHYWYEFIDMIALFGNPGVAGGALKEEGTEHWVPPNTGATNVSGFTALPGGYRESNGQFFGLQTRANFLTTTASPPYSIFSIGLYHDQTHYSHAWLLYNSAASLRCIQGYQNHPPTVPHNPRPGNGAINIAIDTVLIWSCSDPEGDEVVYDLYFGYSNPPPLVLTGLTDTVYNLSPLLFNNSYFWKIEAIDCYGDTAVGSVWNFSTIVNFPPVMPFNPLPQDGAVDIGLDTTLLWSCLDPDGNDLTYKICFGNSYPPPVVQTGVIDTTYHPGTLEINSTYYWQIVAYDIYGDSAVGDTWTFNTITNDPPSTPYSPHPGDGAINIGIDTMLLWSCIDPDGDGLVYKLCFGTANPPPLLQTGLTDTTFNPGILDYDTTYYWKIVAYDPYGDSAVSNLWNFATEIYTWMCGDTITDARNGEVYYTVQIGTQCWMSENLNIGIRIDGTNNQTNNSFIEKFCYDDLETNCTSYGGLYQWNELMQYSITPGVQGICPPYGGWHIPTDEEWKQLEGEVDFLFGYPDPEWDLTDCRGYDVGGNLKSTSGWYLGGNGTDLYGFTGLGAGYRADGSSFFLGLSRYGFFWTSTEESGSNAWTHYLYYNNSKICRIAGNKNNGFNLRCLKD